ncbi:plasmid pRiA4b ORF-3 family protein [Mucilaginibacter paludis]|uniref:Plasmid pRiA4b ORF-3 family protein n=1 Tax=Mucilaginibacter paludis DSM 18603 TaxID=714943 RepID=H1YG23_9SPHI|nr:plasmid pRiA4b ORF-3 family protein [Mucilaginibacter paludis]EHQ26311.1 plasmid pRiA4b ORF-3 family protein [Mucilaginibacter paludis DSM 18603]
MAFQFKITLNHTADPKVWRTLLVPDDISLHIFHLCIQAAFGWENCHLYQFCPKSWGSQPSYTVIDEFTDDMDAEDSDEVAVSEIFKAPKQKFTYIYDFGDSWMHTIVLEKILDDEVLFPMCTGGEGACPPEDCGGIGGYYRMVEILSNPKHAEYREMREWLGMLGSKKKWDVNAFDVKEANDRLHAFIE